MGTMSHSFVLSYDSELEAFYRFVKYNPQNAVLLVDTYNTLEQGMPNAIKVFADCKADGRITGQYGIRIDSGDLAYLTAEARKMLDDAGFTDAVIVASSDLDEYLIKDLKIQGAQINSRGIGTKLITAYDCPARGRVHGGNRRQAQAQDLQRPLEDHQPGVQEDRADLRQEQPHGPGGPAVPGG